MIKNDKINNMETRNNIQTNKFNDRTKKECSQMTDKQQYDLFITELNLQEKQWLKKTGRLI